MERCFAQPTWIVAFAFTCALSCATSDSELPVTPPARSTSTPTTGCRSDRTAPCASSHDNSQSSSSGGGSSTAPVTTPSTNLGSVPVTIGAGTAGLGASPMQPLPSAGSVGSTTTRTATQTTATSGCPTSYSVATHIVINVSWSGSLALTKGTGQVHLWSKSKFVETGDSATVMSRSCGSVLPEIKTSALAGGYSVLPEIPDAAWDAPSMPTFMGTATRSSTGWQVNPGVALVGLSMADPTVAWPDADKIVGIDADGDGALGISAFPRVGGKYQAPPTGLAQTARADELHLAIRSIMTLTSMTSGCPQSYGGVAEVTSFDNHVIGCHVAGGVDCKPGERDFVDSNRTVYKIESGTFSSQRVADSASCADVRAQLPKQ